MSLEGYGDDDVFTTKELADVLGKHPETIRRMGSRGDLPSPAKLWGKNVWRCGDVREHLRARFEKAIMKRRRQDAGIRRLLA